MVPVWKIGALNLTASPFLVPFGSDYSTPDAPVEVLRSLLTDGDLELTSRRGNRTLTIPVLLEGSMSAMAAAEALLVAECDKPLNRLYCDPGDGVAPAMNFTVFRGQVTLQRDDEYERNGFRLYQLTFRALPWPQSTTKVTVAALAATGSTTTLVDAMSATTGWTGSVDGGAVTPSTAGGAVTVASTTALSGQHTVTAIRTGSITTSSTKYLVLDWKAGAGNENPVLTAVGDGIALAKIASAPSPTAGYTRTWFYAGSASSIAALTLNLVTGPSGAPTTTGPDAVVRSLTMDNLDRSDVRPTLGSVMQQVRTFEVTGAAPTVGTIAVQHTSTSLGDVLLYTCPDDGSGYVPPLRPVRVSGNGPTSDATAVSGFYDAITAATTIYDQPVISTPDGEYLVMARLKQAAPGAGSTTVTWSVTPRLNSTDLAAATTGTLTFTAGTNYGFTRLGMVHLPAMDAAPGASSVNRVQVSATHSGAIAVRLDEVYLFNLTTGRLTEVACGTGTAAAGGPSNRLWLDSPTPENDGLGRMLRGFASDRSDAFSAWPSAVSPTVHELLPGIVKVFSVATNPATSVDVSYEYYPAGHSSVPV